MSNRSKSSWKSAKIQKLKSRWQNVISGRNKSDFGLANLLTQLETALADGEFKKFCLDQDDGLGVNNSTVGKYERMMSALAVVPAEGVWQRIGWGGIRKVVQIRKRKEALAVCKAIISEEGNVGAAELDEILAARAPSFCIPRASRSGGPSKAAVIKKNEVLEQENTSLKTVLHRFIAKYPSLKRNLTQKELKELGIDGGQMPVAV